nr:MAG TPA: hypothetical protein [Caudoviricetes sp.]
MRYFTSSLEAAEEEKEPTEDTTQDGTKDTTTEEGDKKEETDTDQTTETEETTDDTNDTQDSDPGDQSTDLSGSEQDPEDPSGDEPEEKLEERDPVPKVEPRVDEPEEEKEKIKQHLESFMGDGVEELTIYNAGEINRPLYHVSMNPNIQRFTPQVSNRTLLGEDRTVPRISTSTCLLGCLNGYQSLISDMDKRESKNFLGLYRVYGIPYQYAIKPSKKLLKDVDISDEYWITSWKKETQSIVPDVIADFLVPKIETVYGSNGQDKVIHIFIHVKRATLYLDHEKQLSQGFYEVIISDYRYNYPLEKNNLEIKEIDENYYRKVTSLSLMIKNKPKR